MPTITNREKKRIVTTTMLVKDIPVILRDHFKAKCALHGVSMKETIIAFMRRHISEQRKE